MQALTIRVSGGADGAQLALTFTGGPFSLSDIVKRLTAFQGVLHALERDRTGKRRATIDWQIVEWALTTVPDAPAPEPEAE